MFKFRIGERARVKEAHPLLSELVGKEVEIMALPGSDEEFPDYYEIEVIGPRPGLLQQLPGKLFSPDYCLQKILPDSDSYQRSTWREFKDVLRDAQKTPQTINRSKYYA